MTGKKLLINHRKPMRLVVTFYSSIVQNFSSCCSFVVVRQLSDELSLRLQAATSIANSELPPTDPIRLGLALNFLFFYCEILNSPEGLTCICLSMYGINLQASNPKAVNVKDSLNMHLAEQGPREFRRAASLENKKMNRTN
ncbi:hypothetical protein Nepgr_033229 [Nepenthes gracilis]|uniref:14-3-3 domain-containing protein n=1 Tax=Nepenthes gracilis TaxID=150966 RepID=A0AAD3TLQ3_NEPGR|nr:hypothetical protein Nepgr_033229 [Nepenthes gracilis]